MTRLARSFEGAVAGLVHASVRHRRVVLLLGLLVLAGSVPGLWRLEVHNRMTEWVDPDDPEAAAFLSATDHLDGLVNFERTLLTYTGDDPDALLSSEALRQQQRLVDRIMADVPEVTGVFGPVRFVQLAQYELEVARGEAPEEARLPDSDLELALAVEAARESFGPFLNYTLTEEGGIGHLGFNFEAEPFTTEASHVGGRIGVAIADAYAVGDLTVLSALGTEPVGVASVTDHVDGFLYDDLVWLGGLGVGLVFVLFWVSARRISWVFGGFLSLGVGLAATVGTIGWLGIPFNVLNFAILPLIMGNGIDYSIHVLAEARMDDRGFGKGLGRHLGKALGVPIILVTLTTCIGLATLGTSPSPYLAQMGLMASLSIAFIALLALTFLPAWLSYFPGEPREDRGSWSPFLRVGRITRRHPVLLAVLVALLAGGGGYAFATMDYEVDLLSGSLPEGDVLLRNQDAFEEAFDTEDAWFLLMEGDVVSEASWAFQERFREQLVTRGLLSDPAATFDLPTLAEGHHRQRSTLGLGAFVPVPSSEATPEEMVAGVEAEAVYEAMLRPLLSEDRSHGGFYVLPVGEGKALAATDAVRAQYQEAVREAAPPDGLEVHVYSFKALARDFMGESQQSLQVLYGVTLVSTLVLFWSVTGDWRATGIVALPVLLSSLWWFGLLKLTLGAIGVYQLISLVFITSIGSDYAAYLVYKHRDTGDWTATMRTTGRAVLFSALTDAGAFWVFSHTTVRSGGEMLLGAALAIVSVFGATLLVVPALLKPKAAEA